MMMNSPAVANTPNLAIAPTQNTAPVFEYRCLYTHDSRRKAKRWQDGFLRLHTFNKRVMVYDVPKNFIGDKHLTQSDGVEDGDELQLDKGVLVQVQELVGQLDQDLTEVVARRRSTEASSPTTSRVPPASLRIRKAATSSKLRPKSLNALLGIIKAPIGRAIIPTKSPFERRQQENESYAQPETAERPAKKIKTSLDGMGSVPLDLQRHHDGDSIPRRPQGVWRQRDIASNETRMTQSTTRQTLDINDEDSPLMANPVTHASRSLPNGPKAGRNLPRHAAPKDSNAANLVAQSKSRPREPSSDDVSVPMAQRSKNTRAKITEAAEEEGEEEEGIIAPPSNKPKEPHPISLDDSPPTKRRKEKETKAPAERLTGAQKREEDKKRKDAAKQLEAGNLLEAQQKKVADCLDRAQRRKDEDRRWEVERRKSPSPPLPTNILRFAPPKPVRKLWYKDLLPNPKPPAPARPDRAVALEDMRRETKESQARIQARLGRQRQSATSRVEQQEEQVEQITADEDPCANFNGSLGVDEPLKPKDGVNRNETPSPVHPRSQGRVSQRQSPQRLLQQDKTYSPAQVFESPPHPPRQSPRRPLHKQGTPQHSVSIRGSPQPSPQRQSRSLSSPQDTSQLSRTVKPKSDGTSITPLRRETLPTFPAPSQITITLLDQQLLAPSRRLSIPEVVNAPLTRAAQSKIDTTVEVPGSPSPPQVAAQIEVQPPSNGVSYNRPIVSPTRPAPAPQSGPRTRRLGLPPGPPPPKPVTRTLHPTAQIPQPAPRRQPPSTRTVVMHRSNSNMSNASATSADTSENGEGGKRAVWAGMNPWSGEAWDILGWWPDDRARPMGI